MINIILVYLINSLIPAGGSSSANTLFALGSALTAIISGRYLAKKMMTGSQNKNFKKQRRKIRWVLLKSYARKKFKFSIANIFALLLVAGIAVLIILWLGWIVGILLIAGLFLLTRVIDKAQKRRDGQ
ncbi:MAG: hypothetical protein ABUT20_14585 [Bacteroidota bacterium]